MLIRRKADERLFQARWNHNLRVGRHHDPALEASDEGSWRPLPPTDMADHFEIVAASEVEMGEMALLTEYGLQFAPDFALGDGALAVEI